MPRLKGVSKEDVGGTIAKYYQALFGDRDPVKEPGTATGTPGNWWTVFAKVPYIFDHATSHFGMFGMFSDKRELATCKEVSSFFLNIVRQLENLALVMRKLRLFPIGKYLPILMKKRNQY